MFAVLDEIGPRVVIHGACGWDVEDQEQNPKKLRGADHWANQWAFIQGVKCTRVAASWRQYGPSAGPRRNREMLQLGPDLVVAFKGGRGTGNMIELARKAGIEVREIG